jgi:hypothetical protein
MKTPVWLPLEWPLAAYLLACVVMFAASLWIGLTSRSAGQSLIRAGLLGTSFGLAISCLGIGLEAINPNWHLFSFLVPISPKPSAQLVIFLALVVLPAAHAFHAGLTALVAHMLKALMIAILRVLRLAAPQQAGKGTAGT